MTDRVKIKHEWPDGTEQAKREKKIREAVEIVLLWVKSREYQDRECGTTLQEKIMELRDLFVAKPRKAEPMRTADGIFVRGELGERQ